ncbi:hypothetical protein T03_8372, partial [Trichinella britovi]
MRGPSVQLPCVAASNQTHRQGVVSRQDHWVFHSSTDPQESFFVHERVQSTEPTGRDDTPLPRQRLKFRTESFRLGHSHPSALRLPQFSHRECTTLTSFCQQPAIAYETLAVRRDTEKPFHAAVPFRTNGIAFHVSSDANRHSLFASLITHGRRILCYGLTHRPGVIGDSNNFGSVVPRLRRSAGFCRPGQCLHAAGSTNCWISATRFRTKGFQRSADDCIHARVTALSHQQVMPCTCRPRIFRTERTSLAATRAPMSSSLGRPNLRIGATCVFDVTKFTTVCWFVVSMRMYATAPYAFSEASLNAWISKRVTWPRATGMSARGRQIFDRSGSSCFQRLYCFITSCGKGSSHDVLRCYRVWRNIFARTVNGAKHPTGSKTRNAVLNNDRFDSPPG